MGFLTPRRLWSRRARRFQRPSERALFSNEGSFPFSRSTLLPFTKAWRGLHLRKAWRGLEGGPWRGLQGGFKGASRGLQGGFEHAWRGLYIRGLGMCKVCTEAVHSEALQVPKQSIEALWTRVTSKVWACVKYVGFKPPSSPLEAPLKPSSSPLQGEAPLEAPFKPPSSPLEAPFKPPWSLPKVKPPSTFRPSSPPPPPRNQPRKSGPKALHCQATPKFFFLQCRIAQDSCGHVSAGTSQLVKKKSSKAPQETQNKTQTNTTLQQQKPNSKTLGSWSDKRDVCQSYIIVHLYSQMFFSRKYQSQNNAKMAGFGQLFTSSSNRPFYNTSFTTQRSWTTTNKKPLRTNIGCLQCSCIWEVASATVSLKSFSNNAREKSSPSVGRASLPQGRVSDGHFNLGCWFLFTLFPFILSFHCPCAPRLPWWSLSHCIGHDPFHSMHLANEFGLTALASVSSSRPLQLLGICRCR